MTDLESPKKNNDCYFYYYSTCSKGENCSFRHEPAALGCETMCSFWKEGKCLNVHCNFRHMELRKNRKAIACYWETQPGGCLKPHCPFMHQRPRPFLQNENSDKTDGIPPETCNQVNNFKGTASVDSLVVNFEEESDNESTTLMSPIKTLIPEVKTLEEIKLEKIAEASAAYYSYSNDLILPDYKSTSEQDLRARLLQKNKLKLDKLQSTDRKLSSTELAHILGDDSLAEEGTARKKQSFEPTVVHEKKWKKSPDSSLQQLDCIKVKTLDEIRSERESRQVSETKKRKSGESLIIVPEKMAKLVQTKAEVEAEAVVSSTSSVDEQQVIKPSQYIKPLRKLNLNKIISKLARSTKPITVLPDEVSDSTSNITKENVDEGTLIEHFDEEKVSEESMLLEIEDDNVSIKAEDELLNEIESLLNN